MQDKTRNVGLKRCAGCRCWTAEQKQKHIGQNGKMTLTKRIETAEPKEINNINTFLFQPMNLSLDEDNPTRKTFAKNKVTCNEMARTDIEHL